MINSKDKNIYNAMFFVMALLASLVPRYISTFKIHLGINISLYTIAVVLAFLLYSSKLRVYIKIECLFFIIWFVYILLSVVRAEAFGLWAYYFVWSLTSVLFAQIFYVSNNDYMYDSIVNGLLVGLCIHLIIGLYEITTHRYLFEVGVANYKVYYGRVPISIFHNPNDYATFLVTVFPFLILRMVQEKRRIRKNFLIGINVLCLYMIIRSESRSAFYAMLIFCITLIWITRKKSLKNKLYLFSLIGLGIIIVLCVPDIKEWILSIFFINRIETGSTDRARYNLIMNGLFFLKQTNGLGVGPGNLRLWLNERSIYYIGDLLYMHNWYVELLVTFGIPFFILYLLFHFGIVTKLIRRFDKKDSIWNMNNAMLVSFVSFSIVSIASSSNIYSEWIWMYLVFISTYVLLTPNKKKINS